MKRQTAEEFAAEFKGLADSLPGDRTEVLEACAPILLEGISQHFVQAQSSGGIPWPPRKDPKPQHPLLNETGALLAAAIGRGGASVHRIVDGRVLELGIDPAAATIGSIRGARRHQWGDDLIRPGGGILARPYMGINEQVADACVEVIADHAIREFE